MIQAQDLRIGNLVLDGHEIEAVNSRMISMLENGEAEFDPIPITKDVLVNIFGLEDGGKGCGEEFLWYSIEPNGVDTINLEKGTIMIKEENQNWWNCITLPEYAHQLQNIIYDLKGIKLTKNP